MINDKDKRKNDKPKNSANDTSLLVYITSACYARRSTTGAQTPLGSEDTVFHYSANFFTRNDFRERIKPFVLASWHHSRLA
jgi:hypothetical protein